MAFEFYKYKDGVGGELYTEQRLCAYSGYPIYKGAALKITGGTLQYAQTAETVYAISNVSAASSVVTASYCPEVIPVNDRQIWKASIGSAVTAATYKGGKINIDEAAELGTAVNAAAAGTSLLIYDLATGSTPSTSAVYVIFQPAI
jgi:hypothetical protein